jgi:uncharacterized Zn ribbon protein
MGTSANDSQGKSLEVGTAVITLQEIAIPNKGAIPNGTTLQIIAFGKAPNHIDVSHGGKTWFIDAKLVRKA